MISEWDYNGKHYHLTITPEKEDKKESLWVPYDKASQFSIPEKESKLARERVAARAFADGERIYKEEKMKTHWICYVEGTDGGIHFKHSSLESAQKEAERLAKLRVSKKVSVYEWKGACQVNQQPVLWDVPEHRNLYFEDKGDKDLSKKKGLIANKEVAIQQFRQLWREIEKSGLSKLDFLYGTSDGRKWVQKRYSSNCPLCEYTETVGGEYPLCNLCPLKEKYGVDCYSLGFQVGKVPSLTWLKAIYEL